MSIIVEGATFDSWNEFADEYESYCDANSCPIFVIGDCRRIEKENERCPESRLSLDVGYYYCEFLCAHSGSYESQSCGERRNQKSLKLSCPAKLRVSYDRKQNKFVIRTFVASHGESNCVHDVDEHTYRNYCINRGFRGLDYKIPRLVSKLVDGQTVWELSKEKNESLKEKARFLAEQNVGVATISEFLEQNADVVANSKDIYNQIAKEKKKMPKVKCSSVEQLCHLVSEFGEQVFATDGQILYCRACNKKISSGKRFLVIQHIQTAKHQKSVCRKGLTVPPRIVGGHQSQAAQVMMMAAANDFRMELLCGDQTPSMGGRKSQFSMDLCAAFIAADIPFWKLDNPHLRMFLEKYTREHVPDESTLRKNYLPECYEETLNMIRNEIRGKKLYVSIDETSDVPGRFVANVVVGTLIPDRTGKMFLLTTEILEKSNHTTIARLFNDAMNLLWPNGVQHDDVLLFISNATPYMIKAAAGLKILYPKMVHLTCLVHAINRVIEEVRTCFPEVDRLVSNGKKVFAKAPSRVQKFKEIAPEVPLPPQVSTRFATWLEAVSYYNTHFEQVRDVLNGFACDEAASIEITQSLLSMPYIKEQLLYITNNFSCLSHAIGKLESEDVSLNDAVGVVEAVQLALRQGHGSASVTIKAKLDQSLAENPGYETIVKLVGILQEQKMASLSDVEEELTTEEVVLFAYAPVTACDVERSFSKYKSILADNRRRFTSQNLKMNFVIHCNAYRYIANNS